MIKEIQKVKLTFMALVMAILNVFLWGAVAEDMWHWFIVPLGAPSLDWLYLIGLSLCLSMIKRDYEHPDRTAMEAIKWQFTLAAGLFTIWGIGAICSL